jgi:hypothetical protein
MMLCMHAWQVAPVSFVVFAVCALHRRVSASHFARRIDLIRLIYWQILVWTENLCPIKSEGVKSNFDLVMSLTLRRPIQLLLRCVSLTVDDVNILLLLR